MRGLGESRQWPRIQLRSCLWIFEGNKPLHEMAATRWSEIASSITIGRWVATTSPPPVNRRSTLGTKARPDARSRRVGVLPACGPVEIDPFQSAVSGDGAPPSGADVRGLKHLYGGVSELITPRFILHGGPDRCPGGMQRDSWFLSEPRTPPLRRPRHAHLPLWQLCIRDHEGIS